MRILIVEDEVALAKSLKKALRKEGYAVDYVTDGETAERRIQVNRNDYDLIILDLSLPGKSGDEVCKSLRALKITIPILILTGRFQQVEDKVKMLDIGADDYLIKPFSMAELSARVRALLRRPVPALDTELKIGDLALDTATRQVKKDGQVIELTVKEFALLEYLMRHPGQVLSRNQILDHLWGFDFDSFSNVIDVHIKNLRRKLGGTKGPVETVRGIGYRIRADNQ